ncbi:phosphoribosylamine--glycine ligase [Candidatus Woesearchaeota archaeon]|nr:phosphoribosylamine--glycine ligase [Candidatus Woesearchaeota archaeon]
MTKVLLVGNGAREHAIAKAIVKSDEMPELFSYMKMQNPGIEEISTETMIGKYDDIDNIVAFAQSFSPDFAVIGPEEPLSYGVVDALESAGIPCVGPKKNLAMLESSKSFARELMAKYKIEGLPKFGVFRNVEDAKKFMDSLKEVVIKPDGLTGGKGVMVQGDHLMTKEEALEYCKEVLKSHPSVIVEEKLDGEEFSLQSFTDGQTILDCPPVQDHKRAHNDDTGPNTGGMGSYSAENHLLPFLKENHIREAHLITAKVADAIKKEIGEPYIGIMYGGFMLTKSGIKLIEYNARLGDPEAMNILSIMESDFVELCRAIVSMHLDDYSLQFEKKATVCKYIVPEGYPEKPVKGAIEISKASNSEVFYSSIERKDNKLYMSGSRAVAFVGKGKTIEEAERKAEEGAKSVKGKVFHREDIGTRKLIDKRINHVRSFS